jgi:hypothetical protein
LQRWANKIRKGDKLRNSVGRESFFEEEDRKELENFVHSDIYNKTAEEVPPASTTSATQPCDRGTVLKDQKQP